MDYGRETFAACVALTGNLSDLGTECNETEEKLYESGSEKRVGGFEKRSLAVVVLVGLRLLLGGGLLWMFYRVADK